MLCPLLGRQPPLAVRQDLPALLSTKGVQADHSPFFGQVSSLPNSRFRKNLTYSSSFLPIPL